MKIKLLIDYLTFTIKRLSPEHTLDISFVCDFLGLDVNDFTMIGPRMHYTCCFDNNKNIFIYYSEGARAEEMGVCVSMSGSGCRYFETVLGSSGADGQGDLWISFFRRLRNLNFSGYGVKISRIDIAADDKSTDDKYLLNLDDVEACANSRDFVSRFRNLYHYTSKYLVTDQVIGRTLYFGSQKSSVFCRFYDKLAEQKVKYEGDPESLQQLDSIKHWVRMEFVFRRDQAIKIVNAICDSASFSRYYAELVNGYLRFVDKDDSNVTRCTLKKWWQRFLGTLGRCKLSVGYFKQYNFARIYSYYQKYLTTTVFTLLSRLPPAEFFRLTADGALGRLKKRHTDIIENQDSETFNEPTMAEWWQLLNPIPVEERVAFAGF